MENKLEERIKNIMSIVFNVSIDEINDKSSPDNIVSWDSLKHMQLVIALEEDFGIHFEDDEIIELLNLALITLSISEKI